MHIKKIYNILFFILILALYSGHTWSFTSVSRDFNELVTLADTIIIGTVTKQESKWDDPIAQDFIHTEITLDDTETLKGHNNLNPYILTIAGGVIPPYVLSIPGAPSFSANQRYILFIKDNNKVVFPLVGIHDGIFIVEESENGTTSVKTIDGQFITTIDQDEVITQSTTSKGLTPPKSISLQSFKQQITHRLQKSEPALIESSLTPSSDNE